MALELTAVRLLAPFFGDSVYVWTNVIGVILLALAVGAFTGGRLAERTAGSPLRTLLLLAGVVVAAVPLLAPSLCGWLLPQDLPLDAALPALVRGSLLATMLLFAAPVWLLGAVSPGLVAALVRAAVPTGRAAGTIGAAGTLGSLIGTFAATHWSVPVFGCRATLWACAVVLIGTALLLPGRRRGAATALLLVLPSLALAGGPLRAALPGQDLLAAAESPYQYLRVVRTPAAGERAARTELKINEGLDSYHSLAIAGRALTSEPGAAPSSYYDYHALLPFLVGDGVRPEGLRALSVGDAAGTFRRVYAGVHPAAVVDGVELDPVAVRLGDEWFSGPRAPGHVVADLDGRVFVERATARWHVVHVDAYSHQVNIPCHLASREFFAAVRERLLPRGAVACNVGGLSADDPVVRAIGGTMAAVFGEARALHVPNSRNVLLVARRDAACDPAALQHVDAGDNALGAVDRAVWAAVLDTARKAAWASVPPADDPLVDDRTALDRLLYRSYVGIDDRAEPTALAGSDSPEGAEAAAYAAFARGDADATLAAAQRSRAATAYLRYLCGAARWLRRELHGAAADYRAGLALAPEPGLQTTLQAGLDALLAELEPVDRAAAVASRSGVLAMAVAAVLLAVAAAVHRWSRPLPGT